MNNFGFLKSIRFWAVVGIAIVGVLKMEGILADDIANAVITILTGYTVIRTVDRTAEFVGGARTNV